MADLGIMDNSLLLAHKEKKNLEGEKLQKIIQTMIKGS